ncbi:oligopeptidase A, partial [Vibrio parahaemolyticus SBR10290]
IRLVRLHASY